jgi:cytochrome c oxidase assembly factor CtaG
MELLVKYEAGFAFEKDTIFSHHMAGFVRLPPLSKPLLLLGIPHRSKCPRNMP